MHLSIWHYHCKGACLNKIIFLKHSIWEIFLDGCNMFFFTLHSNHMYHSVFTQISGLLICSYKFWHKYVFVHDHVEITLIISDGNLNHLHLQSLED